MFAHCLYPYTTYFFVKNSPEQLEIVLAQLPESMYFSLEIVDKRNIWKNNYEKSLILINKAKHSLEQKGIWIAPFCSLLHSSCNLELEINETILLNKIKQWISFAKQKLNEIPDLEKLSNSIFDGKENLLMKNQKKYFVSYYIKPYKTIIQFRQEYHSLP